MDWILKHQKLIIIIIFILATLLRFSLTTVNKYANDNHFRVVKLIRDTGKIPDRDTQNCKQCYHPKLYHLTAASVIKILPLNRTNENQEKIASQYINALAGIITIYVIYVFLMSLSVNLLIRITTFALIALNPRLIAINSQITNDSFVILFSTLAIYFLYKFLSKQSYKLLFFTGIFTALAALSKGSGIILYGGIIIIFLIKLLSSLKIEHLRKKFVTAIILFNIIFIPIVISFGPYYDDFKDTGNPFAINRKKSPLPKFFKHTYLKRKTGVTSIADSFFTFRFINLLKYPFLDRSKKMDESTLNRTSLWTQLYARVNFIHYNGSPNQWKIKNNTTAFIGRIAYLLALLPLGILISGFYVNFKKISQSIKKKKFIDSLKNNEWIFLLLSLLFILFIVKLSIDYRRFITMKVIYIFPVLLCFIKIFTDGAVMLLKKLKNNKLAIKSAISAIALLLVIYVIDIIFLFNTLLELMLSKID